MTHLTQLNDADLDAVSGGLTTFVHSTIDFPKIPQAKDLLTPDQIKKILSIDFNFNPPIPRG